MKKGKKGFLRNAYARSSITSSPGPDLRLRTFPRLDPFRRFLFPPRSPRARSRAPFPAAPPPRASAPKSRRSQKAPRAPACLELGEFFLFFESAGGLAGVRIRIRFRRPTLRLRLGSVVARRVFRLPLSSPHAPVSRRLESPQVHLNLDRLPPVVRVRLRELVPKLGEHRRRRRAKGPRRVPLDVRARAGLVQTVHRVAREHEPRAQKPEVRAAPPRPERGFMMTVSARSAVKRRRRITVRVLVRVRSFVFRAAAQRRVVSLARIRARRRSGSPRASRAAVAARRPAGCARARARARAAGRTRRSSPGSSPARSGRGPAR